MNKIETKINLNLLDLLLVVTILFSITGYLLAKAEKTSLNKVIEAKENIAIELFIPDIFLTDETMPIFQVGGKAGLTIRNRPYTKLNIIKSESKPKTLLIPDLHGSHKTVIDSTRANVKDYLVTLTDTALKTKDGYVIGGNKIKIGNEIELEGFNYRLKGKVVNIYPVDNNKRSQ